MTRQLYETGDDLRNEKAVADTIEAAWRCKLHKLPINYRLDYVAVRDESAVVFCEVKARTYGWAEIDRMGGYIMSLGKWMAAKALYEATTLPFLLAVSATDGAYYRVFRDFTPPSIIVHGRTDRGDWQDVEPCVILPCPSFSKLRYQRADVVV